MGKSTSSKNVLILLGFFIFICDTDGQKLVYGGLESEVKKYIFQCYDCNSEYDPRCGDPFNNYSIGIVNCTEKKIPEQLMDIDRPDRQLVPSVCRKIVQKIEGRTRVIRGCGYIRDPHDDLKCYKRTGTAGVEINYCSCTKSLCNLANSINVTVQSAVILAILSTLNK